MDKTDELMPSPPGSLCGQGRMVSDATSVPPSVSDLAEKTTELEVAAVAAYSAHATCEPARPCTLPGNGGLILTHGPSHGLQLHGRKNGDCFCNRLG